MIKIVLKNNIDNNALSLKDNAYCQVIDVNGFASGSPNHVGEITEIGADFVMVDPVYYTPSVDDFIMFSKNENVNKNSLIGYYAEIKLTNNSLDKAELFSLGSEVTQSSK